MSEVYSPTTAPNPKASCFVLPSKHLDKTRFAIKVCQVLLSFVAFILEETVSSCTSCSPLYFFEFVSCTAFLFTLLLLILLSTTLLDRVGISCWPTLDFVYTGSIAGFFLIASIVFASDNRKTEVEQSAVAFGFLATLLFFVDVGLFLRDNGAPFRADGKPDPSNGVPPAAAAAAPAEAEKLTA